MLHGQINELLVVRVCAGQTGFGGNVNQMGVLVKFGQHVLKSQFVKRQPGCDFWVSKHSLQLVSHGFGSQPVEFVICQRLPDAFGGRVFEDEGVEDNICIEYGIGVEDDGL